MADRPSFRIGDLVRVTSGTYRSLCGRVATLGEEAMLVRFGGPFGPKCTVLFSEAERFRLYVGQRVTVTGGDLAGARARITKRAHPSVRPRFEWLVLLDGTFRDSRGAAWSGGDFAVGEHELGPWTVPLEARPHSVGALQHPARSVRRG